MPADEITEKMDENSKDSDESLETHLVELYSHTLDQDLERAKSKEAILIIIRGLPQGKKFILNQPEMRIGRDPDVEILIDDGGISRKHALIRKTDSGYTLEDLQSRNGSFLNDIKLEEVVELNKEDMIKIGTTILKYIPAGEIEILYQDNLTNAAYMDELTQVFNRNYISQVFEAEFKRAKALHTHFPVLLFDVDNFKRINDCYGHDAGDHVLREVVQVFQQADLRELDLLGRWGGEEFLLLLSNSSIERAMRVSERIRKLIEQHRFLYEEQVIPLTISVGIADVRRGDYACYTDLFKAADQALYESKRKGKNQVTLASSGED